MNNTNNDINNAIANLQEAKHSVDRALATLGAMQAEGATHARATRKQHKRQADVERVMTVIRGGGDKTATIAQTLEIPQAEALALVQIAIGLGLVTQVGAKRGAHYVAVDAVDDGNKVEVAAAERGDLVRNTEDFDDENDSDSDEDEEDEDEDDEDDDEEDDVDEDLDGEFDEDDEGTGDEDLDLEEEDC